MSEACSGVGASLQTTVRVVSMTHVYHIAKSHTRGVGLKPWKLPTLPPPPLKWRGFRGLKPYFGEGHSVRSERGVEMMRTGPSEANAWDRYEPSAEVPWDLPRVVHLHRRAGLGASWAELRRDL